MSIVSASSSSSNPGPTAPTSRDREDRAVSRTLAVAWGGRVAAARAAGALSQAALAAGCGVSQQTISKIERGRMVPLDPLKVRLSRSLDLAPGELFRWPPLAD